MNYTKGEWKIDIIDSTYPKHHQVYAYIKPGVGFVGWDSMGVYDDLAGGRQELKTLNKEAIANAHLISAAPEMYHSLSAIMAVIDREQYGIDWQYVEKALAKAEGKL